MEIEVEMIGIDTDLLQRTAAEEAKRCKDVLKCATRPPFCAFQTSLFAFDKHNDMQK